MKILRKIQGLKFVEKLERLEISLRKDLFRERSNKSMRHYQIILGTSLFKIEGCFTFLRAKIVCLFICENMLISLL